MVSSVTVSVYEVSKPVSGSVRSLAHGLVGIQLIGMVGCNVPA